ncbi:MAG: ABC transporter substrate-binding protein [Gammaproteobacteria bacterium]|nr:ABC transporter substrate-binding protein [Gammaproteobacteria bacterium]MCH9762760.1 ABC transporter substrate-binding protein [Gammaproteobacteria bacterium]
MRGLGLTLGICLLSLSGLLWATPSPVPMLKKTADNIVDVLDKNKAQLKNKPIVLQQTVRDYLLPHIDVRGMARSVLGRAAWVRASNDEKTRFTKAFTELVVRTYSAPLAEYSDEKIMFLPERVAPSGRFTRVNSVIIRPSGQKIPLSYSLVLKKDTWKIYDFSVEGVSLLQSFKTQFGQILRVSNMDSLINELEAQSRSKEAS